MGAVTANLIAVGDMNWCTSTGQPTGSRRPADLVAGLPGPLAVIGDAVQSQVTTLEQYQSCYDPAWGRFNDRVRPVPGNHDYRQAGASGYFSYFGSRARPQGELLGSYTYTVGDWQVFAVNSNCSQIGGCDAGSQMYNWLQNALASSTAPCQLAYWHHPRWSQGVAHGNDAELGPMFSLLYQYRVELLLSGHDHAYQRFAALNPSGGSDTEGVTQIVVGTGGAFLEGFTNSSPAPIVRNSNTFGVLALTLTASGWSTWFVPEAGATFTDSASGTCRAPTTTTPTTVAAEAGLTHQQPVAQRHCWRAGDLHGHRHRGSRCEPCPGERAEPGHAAVPAGRRELRLDVPTVRRRAGIARGDVDDVDADQSAPERGYGAGRGRSTPAGARRPSHHG